MRSFTGGAVSNRGRESGDGGQRQAAQRRQGEGQGSRVAVPAFARRLRPAQVARPAPPVLGGVAVDLLPPRPRRRASHPVAGAGNGGEVENRQNRGSARRVAPQVGEDGVVPVGGVHPSEPPGMVVAPVQGGQAAVGGGQVGHQPPHPGVGGVVQQAPVQGTVVPPFFPGGEFASHKQQFFAGEGEHVGEKQAQVGERPPVIAGHFGKERTFAVRHLVVAERQHEVFVSGVERPERQLFVVVGAVDGVAGQVAERVVHPPHVPLVTEAQAAVMDRAGHPRPGGGLFGESFRPRKLPVGGGVQFPQEKLGRPVLPPSFLVGRPLPFRPGIVQVEHGSHRIHPQAVDVVAVQPAHGGGQEETAHLVAAVVEDGRTPVGVNPLAGVGVFVKVGAVEAERPVRVGGEMGGNPVQNHPYPPPVEDVYQEHQVFGGSVAGGGGVKTGGLIPPGGRVGMFGDRHQFHMGETEVGNVVGQRFGYLPVGGGAVRIVRGPAPRPQMDFVDGHRPVAGGLFRPVFHPLPVAPLVGGAPDPAGPARAVFGGGRVRVGFLEGSGGMAGDDVVFVEMAGAGGGDEPFPDAAHPPEGERVEAGVPVVPVPDHRNLPGVGGPHRKMGSRPGRIRGRLGPHFLVEAEVAALAEQPQVVVGQRRAVRGGWRPGGKDGDRFRG